MSETCITGINIKSSVKKKKKKHPSYRINILAYLLTIKETERIYIQTSRVREMRKRYTVINQTYNLHAIHSIQSELRKVLVYVVIYVFMRIPKIFILRLVDFLKH